MRVLWPNATPYVKQWDIIESIYLNDRTVVAAGNELGKDWIAARIVLWFFLTRHPCRVVTTSAKDQHLRVLWGEIGQAIGTSRYALDSKNGGPLICNHHDLRKLVRPSDKNSKCPLSYVVGMVASQDSKAAMQGHHATPTLEDYLRRGLTTKELGEGGVDYALPRTLYVVDEASSVPDYYMELAQTWAKRIFIFGNPWPCSNFFFRDVEGTVGTDDKGGDIPREVSDGGDNRGGTGTVAAAGELPGGDSTHRGTDAAEPVADGVGPLSAGMDAAGSSRGDARARPAGYLRKVIHIAADDSPNVRLAKAELAAGKEPSGRILVPGVLSWPEYQKRTRLYDEHQKEVSLGGRFYKGKEVFLFPSLWLDRAERLAEQLRNVPRRAKAIGVDPGEGVANTALAAVDEKGLIDLESHKTSDTSRIEGIVLAFARKHQVPFSEVVFDKGGGGKQIADVLKSRGYPVRVVAFGETVSLEPRRGMRMLEEKREVRDDHYAYRNRRAEMYGELRIALDPGFEGTPLGDNKVILRGFALPRHLMRVLRPQLSPIPLTYDGEGRLEIPSKNRRAGEELNEKKKTLIELIGASPDETDALVLALHGLLHRSRQARAGVA